MSEESAAPAGPDFAQGVALSDFPATGLWEGRVGDEPALLVRRGDAISAVGAFCSHYHGPLAQGLVVGETIRCPWHHACFDLRTGEATAPAFDPLPRWRTEVRDGTVFARERLAPGPKRAAAPGPRRIVIVGGGAAGFAAAEMLRREGFDGTLTLVSDDDRAPYDRPNLSKDYLAGEAPEDWMPLRPSSFYAERAIDLRLNTRAQSVNVRDGELVCAAGPAIPFDRLLLAPGAGPVRPNFPGADRVHVLRSFADCEAIIRRVDDLRTVVVLGASFIGLEVAAALRARGIAVHVVAPEARPFERVLGPAVGDFVRALHERHGVAFHLGTTASAVEAGTVALSDGRQLTADAVVAGIGVRPRTELAEASGIAIDRGIRVDAFLQTSAPNVFAAGDVARWPDPHSGMPIRVEHWVVAERQGQTAARNMLGARERHAAVPFFWSRHYDLSIRYVGHAEGWDEAAMDGDPAAGDCAIRYRTRGRDLALATIGRDREALRFAADMERALVGREAAAE